MPVANLKPYNILDTMKPDQKVGKLDEGNDSLDTFIRQAMGKEPLLSFNRAGDSPVQWIQLLQALDYQDLAGWPLLPPKVAMQKCDKCARDFCSTINYRRHVRVHRRALNIDKDFSKNRDLLGVFWDKLSLDEAMEIMSFEKVKLEEVPGSSMIKVLTSVTRRPGFSWLPQVYADAGSALLDLVQASPSRFPISSEELFNILDDASEKTFLCAGTALSLQKFVFDGEAGKIGLELKNIIACTCFLVEQRLVKAWLADKDAEALRCQQLLMEEEEAAHRRQAELLERRRLKKLRQKEQQKAKEQLDKEEVDFGESSSDSLTGPPSVETSSPPTASNVLTLELSELESLHLNGNEEADTSCFSEVDDVQLDTAPNNADSKNPQNADHQIKKGNARRHQIVTRRPLSSSHRGTSNGFHGGAVLGKLGPGQRQGLNRDPRSTSVTNGHKIWTRKTKPENAVLDMDVGILGESKDLNALVSQDSGGQLDRSETFEVLIGSIPITLRECEGHSLGTLFTSSYAVDNQLPHNRNVHEKNAKSETQCVTNRSVKLWRPVGKQEASTTSLNDEKREDSVTSNNKLVEEASTNDVCLPCHSIDESLDSMDSSTLLEEGSDSGPKLFCSSSAQAFLTRRWNEAIAGDHVRLVLANENELPERPDHPDDAATAEPLNPNILCSSENRMCSVGTLEPATNGAPKFKSKAKPKKSGRLKYIPKQKNCA